MTVVYLTRDMMCGKHEKPPTDRAKRLEEVIIAIAERWGTPEFPAIEYLRAWEREISLVPIFTICHDFRKAGQ
jgi:hypothetical protein